MASVHGATVQKGQSVSQYLDGSAEADVGTIFTAFEVRVRFKAARLRRQHWLHAPRMHASCPAGGSEEDSFCAVPRWH